MLFKFSVKSIIKTHLSYKIFLILFAATVLPIGVSSYFTYQNSLSILQNSYIDTNVRLIKQGGQNISNYLDSVNQITLGLYKDRKFMENVTFDEMDFSGTKYNEEVLNNILFSRDDISYLYYYVTPSQTLYSFSRQLYASNRYPAFAESPNYRNAVSKSNGMFIAPENRFVNYCGIGYSTSDNVIMINRHIKDIKTGNTLGLFALALDNRKLGQFCRDITNKDETVLLTDEEGRIYYSDDSLRSAAGFLANRKIKDQEDGYYTTTINNQKNIVVFGKAYDNLILVKVIPYRILENSIAQSMNVNTVIIFFSIAFVIILSVFISFSLSKPIKDLTKSMKKVSAGNFDVQMSPTGRRDEIGILVDIFNEMAKKINALINSEYKLRIAKKNAQLSALQAQINPHFIYNALQSIGTLALRKKAPEIYSMSSAIANMLRYSLQSSTEMVPISTEIDNINNYLYVQKMRFGKRLCVEINVDDEVQNVQVPKLILQPLVENSIKYGIDDSKLEENITIHAVKKENFVEITVADTGKGISGKSYEMIQKWLKQDDDMLQNGEHIGFKNVFNRVRLIYGEQARIDLFSEAGAGTKVTIHIPLIKGSGGQNNESDYN